MNDNPNVCAGLSQKNNSELRDVCKALSIPLSGHETKPQLTVKIKDVQTEREPPRQATLDFGRLRGKTYEWVCPRQTVLRVGGADSRGARCNNVATAKEVRVARGTVTKTVSEGDELTATEVAVSNNDAGPRGRTSRLDETSETHASDGSTMEDHSEVQCNLKTMNEQQRAMLRKSGKQLFMDDIDHLTKSEARHIDLAEIGIVGQSELLSTCELLGRRTLRISQDTGCDLLAA